MIWRPVANGVFANVIRPEVTLCYLQHDKIRLLTSHFPMHLVTLVSVLTVSLHWRNRWANCQLTYLQSLTKNLVSSLVLSSLDYCNAFLAGSPQVLLDRIQRVTNCSARFICKAPKSAHITALRSPLVINQKPDLIQNSSHLLPLCLWYSSSISLWVALSLLSSSLSSLSLGYSVLIIIIDNFCIALFSGVPILTALDLRMGRRIMRERFFQYTGPVIWNSLPLSVSHSSLFSSFKSKLETHLFSSA